MQVHAVNHFWCRVYPQGTYLPQRSEARELTA